MKWPWSKPDRPLTAVEVIENELRRVHRVEDQYNKAPPQYVIDNLTKLHDALISLAQIEVHNKVGRIIDGNEP